jgi:hypothetical protein
MELWRTVLDISGYSWVLIFRIFVVTDIAASHMITTRAHLDVHSLICVLEITATRLLAGLKPDLHGLVIPSSWLFTLAQHQRWPAIGIMAYLSHLLKPLICLVQEIKDGCGT